jgi:regulator of replication initiation timing
MTDDIVTRLRNQADWLNVPSEQCEKVADEIEWMLKEIQQLKHDSTIFINERSDAICENFDLREENAELRDEIERLRAALQDVISVSDRKTDIYDRAKAALGYEHLTPETVQAIRDTCSTPASRVGKTQSEVFKEEDTP